MKRFLIKVMLLCAASLFAISGQASPYNIAASAKVTASSSRDADSDAGKATDVKIRVKNAGEWASGSGLTFWGQIDYPWIQLDWDTPVAVNKVIIYERPEINCPIPGGILKFSDGSGIAVNEIPDNGSPKVVGFLHSDSVFRQRAL